MVIADTNVVSEFRRDTLDPAVLNWAQSIDPPDLTICVVTVEEIERGLGRLPEGRRRRNLQQRCTRMLATFAETVLLYYLLAARETAAVFVAAEGSGRGRTLADTQIAGICLAGSHYFATRIVKDFAGTAA